MKKDRTQRNRFIRLVESNGIWLCWKCSFRFGNQTKISVEFQTHIKKRETVNTIVFPSIRNWTEILFFYTCGHGESFWLQFFVKLFWFFFVKTFFFDKKKSYFFFCQRNTISKGIRVLYISTQIINLNKRVIEYGSVHVQVFCSTKYLSSTFKYIKSRYIFHI